MVRGVIHKVETSEGVSFALTVFDERQLRRILARVFDENEFLSPAGIRSLAGLEGVATDLIGAAKGRGAS